MLRNAPRKTEKITVLGQSASSACVGKGLKLYGVVSGADGADSSPVIKASQEKRTRH